MLRVCRSNTFPLGPARVPRRKTVMIESTASGGAGVTGSPSGELSTWQLGVKHSITKRCTRGPCREVRLVPVAGPHRVRAPPQTLSVQVEPAVGGSVRGVCAWPGSWPKTCGRVRGNRSVDRRISAVPATAPVRPLGRSGVSRPAGARVGGLAPRRAGPGPERSAGSSDACAGRGRWARSASRAACAACRSERRSRARQAAVTAASPRAAPVAPASEVPYQTRTRGTRTQLKAAQRTRSPTVS